MRGKFQTARQDLNRLPSACTYDGRGVIAVAQKILRCADTDGTRIEGLGLALINIAFARAMLDDGFCLIAADCKVDGAVLVDAAKQWLDIGPAPFEPPCHQIADAPRRKYQSPHAKWIIFAASDDQAKRTIWPLDSFYSVSFSAF
jgi:hypothetical protein